MNAVPHRPLAAFSTRFFLLVGMAIVVSAQDSEIDMRKTLEGIVQSESNGAIGIKRFANGEVQRGQEGGREFCVRTYKAELQFLSSGIWQFGRGLEMAAMTGHGTFKPSFLVTPVPDFSQGPGGRIAMNVRENKWRDAHPGEMVDRGERHTIVGKFVFVKTSDGWRNVKHTFESCTEPEPWVLPAEDEPNTTKAQAIAGAPITSEQRRAIENNLRQFAAAADQFYLEQGKSTATFADLVGPDKYIRPGGRSVAGEDYSKIRFEQGKPLSVTTSNGEVVSVRE